MNKVISMLNNTNPSEISIQIQKTHNGQTEAADTTLDVFINNNALYASNSYINVRALIKFNSKDFYIYHEKDKTVLMTNTNRLISTFSHITGKWKKLGKKILQS